MKHPADNNDQSAEKVDWSGTLEHAKAGYQNAQDIIKFIDTKTGAVTGLSTLIIGGVFGIITWYFGLEVDLRTTILNSHAFFWASVLLGISLFAGFLSLISSLHSLVARCPCGPTILFPYVTKKQEKDPGFYRQITDGMSSAHIRDEYRQQILTVGKILREKIRWHRCAVRMLFYQLNILIIAASLIGMKFVVKSIVTEKSQPPAPAVNDIRPPPPSNAASNSTDSANGK